MALNVMKNFDKQPVLTIIVPVYNVVDYLEECLDSILHQSYSDWELILVDDGSNDGSAQICDNYSKLDPRIRTVHKENGGLSSARNAGLDIMKGRYVTFVDSDDVILGNDTLARLMSILHENQTLDALQYDVLFKYDSPYEHTRKYDFKVYHGVTEILDGYLNESIHVSCCDKIFKAEVFKPVRFPLNEISEDIAIIPNLLERMHTLRTCDIGYYGYRYREGSISCSTLPYWKICSILKSYYKYLSFAYRFKNLRKKSIEIYTRVFWNYSSTLRQSYPEKVKVFVKLHVFIRISFIEWLKMSFKSSSLKTRLRIFILCVCGIRSAIRFQNLVTRK